MAVIAFVAMVAVACVVFLLRAETPWQTGVVDKIRAEEMLTIGDTISAGLWLGAAINLGLAIGLLATASWWARSINSDETPAPRRQRATGVILGARAFWLLTLLAVVVAGCLRAPRLDHSLWNDEEQAFRKFTWGEYESPDAPKQTKQARKQAEAAGPDDVIFDPADWQRGLFYSINGNNHVVHTVAARITHGIWRAIVRPEPEIFRERVVRLEPFTSGLLVIVALAGWLRITGFPLAGVASAWMMALHPWLLRYGAEARGYAAMLLFIVLAFLCLTLALRTRRWRWWLGFGAAQCLYLLCFAGAVYLAVAMNLIAVALLIKSRDFPSLGRWVVSCVLGAMAFLQIMTAAVMRIWNWIQAPDVQPFPMNAAYFRDFWGHLSIGAPWASSHADAEAGVNVLTLSETLPAWGFAFAFVLPILLLAGLAFACWKSPGARLLFGTLVLTATLIFLHNLKSELAFYGWYALYFSIGFIVALGFAPELIASFFRKAKPAAAGLAATAVLAIFFGWIGAPSLQAQRTYERHPMREAVTVVRGEAPAIDARHAALLTGAVGSGANQLHTYDPRVRRLQTVADLDAFIAESRETGKPLAIYVCGPRQLASSHPDLAERLEDETLFEKGDYLPGIEEFWSFQLLRLKADAR